MPQAVACGTMDTTRHQSLGKKKNTSSTPVDFSEMLTLQKPPIMLPDRPILCRDHMRGPHGEDLTCPVGSSTNHWACVSHPSAAPRLQARASPDMKGSKGERSTRHPDQQADLGEESVVLSLLFETTGFCRNWKKPSSAPLPHHCVHPSNRGLTICI